MMSETKDLSFAKVHPCRGLLRKRKQANLVVALLIEKGREGKQTREKAKNRGHRKGSRIMGGNGAVGGHSTLHHDERPET
jgi:hypothetical protein